MIFKFKAKRETLSRINDIKKDNSKYYKCKFYLDRETWGDTEIFAVFKNEIGYKKIVPLGKYADVLSCTLPTRMMLKSYFKVHIYSKNELKTNEVSIFLSEKCDIKVKRENAFDKLLREIQTKIDNIQFEDNQLKCYSGDTLIDTIYIDNVDEAIVKEQVEIHFQNFEEKINEQLKSYLTEDDINFRDGILYIR